MHSAAASWAAHAAGRRPDVTAVGYIGSYARGDWGPGSDLDLIVIIEGPLPPVGERARGWDTATIPVPVELQLYSRAEWKRKVDSSARWRAVVRTEAVWLVGNPLSDLRS